METQKTNWPGLDQASFLIDHTCVPRYAPHYCAEAAQLMSMLADSLREKSIGGSDDGEK